MTNLEWDYTFLSTGVEKKRVSRGTRRRPTQSSAMTESRAGPKRWTYLVKRCSFSPFVMSKWLTLSHASQILNNSSFSEHWYVIIVCNPGQVLSQKKDKDFEQERRRQVKLEGRGCNPFLLVLDSLPNTHSTALNRIRSYLTVNFSFHIWII